ncbi:MAG: hypothetical protein JOS17DRAFT_823826 [Linnemannia elongata]|nr:MAG: hypothetical protein JOS17DRAFT_823826 [Linnemannia elongata]
MQQFYLQKRPTQWALAIAGFRNKPFHLARNEVNPSHALQGTIFPFIETLIGSPGSKKNTAWRKECIMEMDQFDPNNTKELETVLPESLVSLPESEGSRRPTVYRGRSNVTYVLRLMQCFQGPIPGYSGQSNHFGFTSVPGPGWLPPSGRNSGISASTSKQNQCKSVRGSIPVAIRPLHPGSDIQGLPSTAALPSSRHPSSELELQLRDQPKDTQPPVTHPSVPAVGQSTSTGAGKHTPTRRSQGPRRDDWIIWSRDHKSTKSIYEEYLRYERELAVKLEPTDGKSKHRGKLAQRLAGDTEKHVSNIRRITKEVELL